MRQLPPLKALRAFEAAARHESFAAAASELFLTPSAVSHQIKALERHLGIALFSRRNRKVELTPIGEKYFTSVRQTFNELEVATQRLTAGSETDIVTLSVAPNFLVRWLMPRMQHFQQRYPEVELQISTSIGLVDFTNQHVDMAVYFGNGDWEDVDSYLLTHIYLVPMCAPGLLETGPPLESPEDLRQHTLIHVSKRMYEWPQWLELAGVENKGFHRDLKLSSGQLATAAAREGLGVALADSTLSHDELRQGHLICPFDIQLDTHKSFYLVHQKGKPLTQGMQLFKDWVMEQMQP